MRRHILFTIAMVSTFTCLQAYAEATSTTKPMASSKAATKVEPLLVKPLSRIDDKDGDKDGAMLKVTFPPGGSDAVHRHNAHVFVYVLEGEVIMQLKGGKAVTLKAGDTFYETPDDVHVVGKNASDTESATFLAFFVKNSKADFVLHE